MRYNTMEKIYTSEYNITLFLIFHTHSHAHSLTLAPSHSHSLTLTPSHTLPRIHTNTDKHIHTKSAERENLTS